MRPPIAIVPAVAGGPCAAGAAVPARAERADPSRPAGAEGEDLQARARHWDVPGPRYTSYPTADRFSEGFGAHAYRDALACRDPAAPLSLYVHVPYCASLCWYCGCHKIVTRHAGLGPAYVDLLAAEIALQRAALGAAPGRVTQLHLGGGTPTFLDDASLARLAGLLEAAFDFAPGAERAIEIDPRTVDAARMAHLAALGFDRLSFGVQDFDPVVQQAIHRVQPQAQVEALMQAARTIGFASINVDLIHGLPQQTPASLARTVGQVAALRPDRIALYGYAHLPQRFKAQRRIPAEHLPCAEDRVAMRAAVVQAFVAEGYVAIGMDHFALPGDALAVAKRSGRLQRDFQGYGTQPEGDLIGLGVSAIGRIGACYAQNEKTVEAYAARLAAGELPVVRGLALGADDVVRRTLIMSLMCRGRIDYAEVRRRHAVDVPRDFAPELARLAALARDGLVELEPDGLRVTPLGAQAVRLVAMVFDRYLDPAAPGRYSKVV